MGPALEEVGHLGGMPAREGHPVPNPSGGLCLLAPERRAAQLYHTLLPGARPHQAQRQ